MKALKIGNPKVPVQSFLKKNRIILNQADELTTKSEDTIYSNSQKLLRKKGHQK